MRGTCRNCEYNRQDQWHEKDYICCNGLSEFCGDYTEADMLCDDFVPALGTAERAEK